MIGHIYCQRHAEVSVEQFCPKCKDATVKERDIGMVKGGVGISGVPRSAISYHQYGSDFCSVCLTPVPVLINGSLLYPHDGLDIPLSEYPLEKFPELQTFLLHIWIFLPLIMIISFFLVIFYGGVYSLYSVAKTFFIISILILFFIIWNSSPYGFARDRRVEFHSKGYAGHTLRHHHKYPSQHGVMDETKPHLKRHESTL
jgi:hypothetical protein